MGLLRRTLRTGVVALGGAVMLAGCGATGKPSLSPQFKEQLESFREQSGEAVRTAIERQRDPHAIGQGSPKVHTLQPNETVWVQAGKSQILRLPRPARRVSIGNPDIAGLVIVGPDTIVLNGKELPEENVNDANAGVRVGRSGTFLGRTLTKEPRFHETTLIIWQDDEMVIHPLIVADFTPDQVMLEVTVAELNRSALEQHGLDFRIARDELIAAGWMGAGLPPTPDVTFPLPPNGGQVPLVPLRAGNGGPTYALIFPDENVAAFIQALQTEGLATVLAQPKLTAMSGQTAVFQVGGEIPIRVSSGFVADIEFKPFGTLVNFIPRVTDSGEIFLTVTPEVSEADFTQTVEGIPTFRTRRASTTTRLRDGETLVLGGLLQRKIQEEVSGVPYLKDIPYLGYAFRSTNYSEQDTELMVVVRPTIVSPMAPGVEVPLPTDTRGPLTRDDIGTPMRGSGYTRPRFLDDAADPAADEDGAVIKDAPVEATDPDLPSLP